MNDEHKNSMLHAVQKKMLFLLNNSKVKDCQGLLNN